MSKFDSYDLIPAHIRDSDTSKAYRMVCDAINQVYREHQDLIGKLPDIRSPRFGNQSLFEAWSHDRRIPNLQFFPDTAKSTLFADLSNHFRMKGTYRSAEAIARLLGFNATIKHLWATLAYPDPNWIQNPVNNDFFGDVPDDSPDSGDPLYPVIGYGTDSKEFCDAWDLSNPGEACPWGHLNQEALTYRRAVFTAQVLNIGPQFVDFSESTDLRNFKPDLPGGLRFWIRGFRKEVYIGQYDPLTPHSILAVEGIDNPPGDVQEKGYEVQVFWNLKLFPSNFFDFELTFPPELRNFLVGRPVLLTDEEEEKLKNEEYTQEEMEVLMERMFWTIFSIVKEFLPAKAIPRKIRKIFISRHFSARVWRDLTGNDNHATQTIQKSNPKNWLLGSGVRFQEGYLTVKNSNTLPPPSNTDSEWFLDTTIQNATARQVVYSQGNFDNGALVYIVNNRLVFGIWSENWGPFYHLYDITGGERITIEAKLDGNNLSFHKNGDHQEDFPVNGGLNPSSREGVFAILGRSFGEERFSGGILQGGFYFRGVAHVISYRVNSEYQFIYDASIRDLRSFVMVEGTYQSVQSQFVADDLVQQDYNAWLEDPGVSLCNLEEFIPDGESTGDKDPTLAPNALVVEKSAQPSLVETGQNIVYSIEVRNEGDIAALNTSLRDVIEVPEDVEVDIIDDGGFNVEVAGIEIILTQEIGYLEGGGVRNFSYTLRPTEVEGSGVFVLSNVASVSASNALEDSVSDSVETSVENPSTTLSISKTCDESTVHRPDDLIEYEIQLNNTGDYEAVDIVVVDTITIPEEIEISVEDIDDFDSHSLQGQTLTLTKTISALAVSGTQNLSYTLKVEDGPADNTTYNLENSVVASAENVETEAEDGPCVVQVRGPNPLDITVAWSFDYQGFDQGDPWSLVDDSPLDLRIDFEDDSNCLVGAPNYSTSNNPAYNGAHSGVVNMNTQTGRAVCEVKANRRVKMTVEWDGLGEVEDPQPSPIDPDDPPGGATEQDIIDSWDALPSAVYEEMRLFIQVDPNSNNPGTGENPVTGETLIGRAIGPGGGNKCSDLEKVLRDPRLPGAHIFEANVDYRIRIWVSTNDNLFHYGAFYQFKLKFEEVDDEYEL